jgi:DNA-binding NarL/FixJ family response regulator
VNTYLSAILDAQIYDTIESERLSVALIGPNEGNRQTLARALTGVCSVSVREFDSYPPGRNDLPQMLAEFFEVVIVDLDTDPDAAFELVEKIGGDGTATVMVYSESHDPTLAIRFMRAGARDYFLLPLDEGVVEEAFGRIAPNGRAKASLQDNNPVTLAGPRGEDDRDFTEIPHAIDASRANERVSSLEIAAAISGPEPGSSVGISLELPKTLPADFSDWDNDDLCEMVLGKSDGLEVALSGSEISNTPKLWVEHKTSLAPSKGELHEPVPYFSWPVSADDKAGFPGRVVQRQYTSSAKTEYPTASSGSGTPIVEGKGDTLEGSKKMQEADEVLFQMFRSAPKPKQGRGFASRVLCIFRRERQGVSVFEDPHTSTV